MSEDAVWTAAGVEARILVSSHSTGGLYTICQVDTAGGEGSPLHAHRYEDALFYILRGDFHFQIGDRSTAATPDTSIFIPRGTAYAFRNQGSGPGRFLLVAAPGGMDLFIRDVGALARRGALQDTGQWAPILEKHGIVVP
jgi:mannose-6-phosphate isomerase-like protein (cupin superfamily)